jgi:hypothetical protein
MATLVVGGRGRRLRLWARVILRGPQTFQVTADEIEATAHLASI